MQTWINHFWAKAVIIHIRDTNLAIIVRADILASNGARPSEEKVLTTYFHTKSVLHIDYLDYIFPDHTVFKWHNASSCYLKQSQG